MDSEKFLVFLVSSATCAIGLLLLSALLKQFILLGNVQFSGALVAVLLSLIFNILILSVNKIVSVVSVNDNQMAPVVVSFIAILLLVAVISSFVQIVGLRLLNIWGGVLISIVITAIQFFTSKYTFIILSRDF